MVEQFRPEIRRARYQRLTIYEVEESELDLLGRGSPDSLLLSVAIAAFTLAASFTVTLLTATFASDSVRTAVVATTVVGYVAGAILVAFWARTRCEVSRCVRTIRDRLPPDWVVDSLAPEAGSDAEPNTRIQQTRRSQRMLDPDALCAPRV